MTHFYASEPIDRESRETSILYDAKDKYAHIYTCDKKIIRSLLTHEEDIDKIIHYPNNVDEYVASVDKKRVSLRGWRDPSVKTNHGNNFIKRDADDEFDEEEEEEEEE